MLTNLHIENIAVARRIDLDFSPGFTVLTGETGAGKSVIVGAISLLTGGKFDRDLLRSGEERALVSAVFSELSSEVTAALSEWECGPDEDGCLYLQRSLTADGRSQCRINGRTVPSSLLRDVGSLLINIHGQHENQKLLRAASHRDLLDRFADNAERLARYRDAYQKWRALETEMQSLKRDDAERERLREILAYQIKEIDAAHLKSGEEEEWNAERARLRSADKIAKQCKLIERALYQNEKGVSACEMIARAIPAVEQLSDFLPDAKAYAEKLSTYRSELEDMAQRITQVLDLPQGEDPQAALDRVESRLSQIGKLERKYGTTVDDVLQFRAECVKRLHDIENSTDRLCELEVLAKKAEQEARKWAQTLHENREQAAKTLQTAVGRELTFLDMEKVIFSVEITPSELSPHGADEIVFLISPNPGEPPKPMERIASGGELSRIMLALKCVLQGKEATDTLIFDEVDTGVSGRTSQRIGIKLRQVASSAQVLCVTHAAQIASAAHSQFRIYKQEIDGRTESAVQFLNEDERIHEIARIMGGASITDGLLAGAAELLHESVTFDQNKN